jgi:plastocyanin domain-containing protein
MFAASESTSNPPEAASSDGALQLTVANNGYFPGTLHAKANQPITLDLVTDNTVSCARDFVIPALDVYELLPKTGRVTVNIPAQEPGAVLRFTCSMGMYTGQIVFEN